MGCNCGKSSANRRLTKKFSRGPNSQGNYPLATYPDCTTLYPVDGPNGLDSIIIIGRETEVEKLFRRGDITASEEYLIANWPTTHENLNCYAVCRQAVVDTLGA